MPRSKKKKAALGFGGMALAFMGLFALKGAGGGTTPPPPTGDPVYLWLHNRESSETIYITKTNSGAVTPDIFNAVLHRDRTGYSMAQLYTGTDYFVYGRSNTTSGSLAEGNIGTVFDSSGDGTVSPPNTDTFLINGAATKVTLPDTRVDNDTWTLMYSFNIVKSTVAATTASLTITQRAFS